GLEATKVARSATPGAVAVPTLANAEAGGVPAVPSFGGTNGLPFGFGAVPAEQAEYSVVPDESTIVARCTSKDRMVFETGAVKLSSTSFAEIPLSRLLTLAATSAGASAPLFTQMLNVDTPAGFGS